MPKQKTAPRIPFTFHYNRHEDDALVTESIPALEFISRLIQHIPERQFKMIRYYGIYARHRQQDKKLYRAVSKEKHTIFLSFNRWRSLILSSFGYDLLKCPCCGCTMEILEVYYNHKPVSLQELYKKAMKKYPCRSPAKQKPFTSPSFHAKIKISWFRLEANCHEQQRTCREASQQIYAKSP